MEPQAQAQNPRPRIPNEFLHKNRLQEYAQRSAMSLPNYHTVNEGSTHQPQFRSTVVVDGSSYTSQTFSQRKEAEQDAAKLALSSILKKIKDEGCPIINEDMTFCKSIVNEFAAKMNLEFPTYNTIRIEGLLPSYVSTVVFHGKTFTGNPCKSKKEAEQLVARDVIQTLLGTESRETIYHIINAKKKLYATYKARESNLSLAGPSSVTIPESNRVTPPLKKPKLEQPYESTVGSTGNVASFMNLPPYADLGLAGNQGTTTTLDRKLPRKNKKKVQREKRSDGSPGAVRVIQKAACSVAQ